MNEEYQIIWFEKYNGGLDWAEAVKKKKIWETRAGQRLSRQDHWGNEIAFDFKSVRERIIKKLQGTAAEINALLLGVIQTKEQEHIEANREQWDKDCNMYAKWRKGGAA